MASRQNHYYLFQCTSAAGLDVKVMNGSSRRNDGSALRHKSFTNVYNQDAKKRPFTCDICTLSFTTKVKFLNHQETEHVGFTCEFCSQSFSKIADLMQHRKCHNTKLKFTCDVCQKVFSSKQNLSSHTATHSLPRNLFTYSCEVCAEIFFSQASFQAHCKTHVKRKEVNRFPNTSLNRQSVELTNTLFSCHVCRKSFTQKSQLQSHMKSKHEDTCLKCNKSVPSFKERCNNKRLVGCEISCVDGVHYYMLKISTPNGILESFVCIRCKKTIYSEIDMKNHISEHILQESNRQSSSSEFSNSVSQPRANMYSCPTYKKSFATQANLERHVEELHIDKRTSACQICPKSSAESSQAFDKRRSEIQCQHEVRSLVRRSSQNPVLSRQQGHESIELQEVIQISEEDGASKNKTTKEGDSTFLDNQNSFDVENDVIEANEAGDIVVRLDQESFDMFNQVNSQIRIFTVEKDARINENEEIIILDEDENSVKENQEDNVVDIVDTEAVLSDDGSVEEGTVIEVDDQKSNSDFEDDFETRSQDQEDGVIEINDQDISNSDYES